MGFSALPLANERGFLESRVLWAAWPYYASAVDPELVEGPQAVAASCTLVHGVAGRNGSMNSPVSICNQSNLALQSCME